MQFQVLDGQNLIIYESKGLTITTTTTTPHTHT